jgi:hypothetical protein
VAITRRLAAFAALSCAAGLVSARVTAAQTAPATLKANDTASVPRYRLRVLGAFDDETGAPLQGVTVLALANGMSAATTQTGTVSLVYAPEGLNLLRLQKLGYAPLTLTVSISATDTAPVTVTMQKVAELGAVVTQAPETPYISPNLNGFEERMHSHMGGSFLGDSVLRANESEQLTGVMRSRVSGAAFFSLNLAGDQVFLYSTRSGGAQAQCAILLGCPVQRIITIPPYPNLCYAAVWLDNTLVYDPRTMYNVPPPDINSYLVSNLAGIEFYPGSATVPAEFTGGSTACGVLVLWTREK